MHSKKNKTTNSASRLAEGLVNEFVNLADGYSVEYHRNCDWLPFEQVHSE